MTITYLKKGKSDAARADDDAKTRAVVEQTLQDIETRGDTAVRAGKIHDLLLRKLNVLQFAWAELTDQVINLLLA